MSREHRDVITDTLARGLRRRSDKDLEKRIDRMLADEGLVGSRRFGPTVRRLNEQLSEALGYARVRRIVDRKKRTVWAVALPDADGRDRLALVSVQRTGTGIERDCWGIPVRSTTHCRERLIQIVGSEPAPIASLLWSVGLMSMVEPGANSAGTLLVAMPTGLVIGRRDDGGEIELRTMIASDALSTGKRAVWGRLLQRRPPWETRPNVRTATAKVGAVT